MDQQQSLGFQYDLNTALRGTLALVLAGGRGTRLMQLTEDEAKPAIPFGGKFRIIDFTLSNCINSGIRRVGVLTQYKAHNLIQHVQRGWGFLRAEFGEFIELWPAQQQTPTESWYRGTADAVYQNIGLLKSLSPDYILVLAGDHVYKQDYSRLIASHIEGGADVTVSCVDVPLKDASAFGVVGVDDKDFVVSFLEKPQSPPSIPDRPDRAFASMGIYVFNADFLFEQIMRDADVMESTHDFGRDLLPYLVPICNVKAHRFSESCVMNEGAHEPYWRDVGTVDAYWEANIDLTTVTPALDIYDPDWPIWTYQIQRPGAKFVFDDEDRRGMAVDSIVCAGCVISGATIRRSLLFNDVRVSSYALVEDTLVLPHAFIGRNARLRKTIVGSRCVIPEDLVVGESLKKDAKRFFVTKEGVTLITAEMLQRL